MKSFETNGLKKVILIQMGDGDLLLESINETIKKYNIVNGVVLSGIGTLKKAKLHYVNTLDPKPENIFEEADEPFELCSIDGLIIDGEPHLHFVNSARNKVGYIGHLETDCVVHYLAEVAIAELDCDDVFTRTTNQYGIGVLGEK